MYILHDSQKKVMFFFNVTLFCHTQGIFGFFLLHKSFIVPILIKFGINFDIFITHIVA